MRVYYAHSVSIYNTKREDRDLKLLQQLGFEVVNPNDPVHEDGYTSLKEQTGNGMPYFNQVIEDCQVLAFRAHPDGTIPAGVAKEIDVAIQANIPVIELPSSMHRRAMTVQETREYLVELGAR